MLLLLSAQHINIDCEDDDRAGHHRLPFGRDGHDAQTVDQHAHDECADDRTADAALTTAHGSAADDARRDGVHLVARARARLCRVQAGSHEPGRKAGHHAAQGVADDLPLDDVDAGEARRLLIGADGKGVTAEDRFIEQKGCDRHHGDHDEDAVRNVDAGQLLDEGAGRHGLIALDAVHVDRARPRDDQCKTLADHHHTKRLDEGRHLAFCDQKAVDEADQRADQDAEHHAEPDGQLHGGGEDRHHDAAERHIRADRDVAAAADHDIGDTDGQDAVDRGRQQNARKVAEGEEVIGQTGEYDDDQHKAGQDDSLLQHVARCADLKFLCAFHVFASYDCRSVASFMTDSCVASLPSITPVSLPSLMTAIRSLSFRISAISEEIMMMDLPASASCRSSS